ncbi:MAG: M48 family metallopeptidase [Candidatus Omnitrophica bacterium]|nr:M48 family metallopeptidase [Candidatus Omnitrophota bacterium]
MNLEYADLTVKREKTYFVFVLIISIIGWIALIVTVVGLVIGLLVALFIWLASGLLIARLRTEAVKIDEKQMPELYATYLEVCRKLQLVRIPELFVIQSSGFLNAFATQHAGRDFVVLYSDIVEAYDQKSNEIRFLIGHEIGHVGSKHVLKHALLFPGLMLPLLGPGYSRACEASCDRFGAFACDKTDGGINALMVLVGGKQLGRQMDPVSFAAQYQNDRGFFVSWHEVIWPYPTASERVAQLLALRDHAAVGRLRRHPLAYLLGFFSFGLQQILGVYIICLLAAIAIPNILRAKMVGNNNFAKATIEQMNFRAGVYAKAQGRYPANLQLLMTDPASVRIFSACGKTVSGYRFSCDIAEKGYAFSAMPENKGITGTEIFNVSSNQEIENPVKNDGQAIKAETGDPSLDEQEPPVTMKLPKVPKTR